MTDTGTFDSAEDDGSIFFEEPSVNDLTEDNSPESLEEVLKNLELSNLRPNREIGFPPSGVSSESDADSSSGATSAKIEDDSSSRRASVDTGSVRSRNSNGSIVSSEKMDEIWAVDYAAVVPGQQRVDGTNPVSILKKTTDAQDNEPVSKRSSQVFKRPMKILGNIRRRSLTKLVGSKDPVTTQENYIDYSKIQVDSLPQRFVCKYLGYKPVRGLHGIKHVRNQIDILVEQVTKQTKGEEVPLAQLTIWEKGIQINAHPSTKNLNVDKCVRPIEFVTFCVQDIKYFKIVAFIYITEMSKTSKKAECHVYVCDSPYTARRLALSVSLAFQRYAKRLGQKRPKMQVDLRTVDEIELDLKAEYGKDKADSDA
ncbi:uncharacterized protein LOC141907048 [Tubulanus polymorphus]|uniref:uncharacterized protein LOC141907048 n=1 Tax=Tubulanus polymorphus TaxID=672921 RepID=UPI003DA22A5B